MKINNNSKMAVYFVSDKEAGSVASSAAGSADTV